MVRNKTTERISENSFGLAVYVHKRTNLSRNRKRNGAPASGGGAQNTAINNGFKYGRVPGEERFRDRTFSYVFCTFPPSIIFTSRHITMPILCIDEITAPIVPRPFYCSCDGGQRVAGGARAHTQYNNIKGVATGS